MIATFYASYAAGRRFGAPDRRVGKHSKSARRCRAKTLAGHLRESQTWLERHGTNQLMPATRFAAPSFEFDDPMIWSTEPPGKAWVESHAYPACMIKSGHSPAEAGHYVCVQNKRSEDQERS